MRAPAHSCTGANASALLPSRRVRARSRMCFAGKLGDRMMRRDARRSWLAQSSHRAMARCAWCLFQFFVPTRLLHSKMETISFSSFILQQPDFVSPLVSFFFFSEIFRTYLIKNYARIAQPTTRPSSDPVSRSPLLQEASQTSCFRRPEWRAFNCFVCPLSLHEMSQTRCAQALPTHHHHHPLSTVCFVQHEDIFFEFLVSDQTVID